MVNRWSFIFLCGLLVFLTSGGRVAATAGEKSPEGVWVGRCQIDGADVLVRLTLRSQGKELTGGVQIRSLGLRVPLVGADVTSDQLVCNFQMPSGPVTLSGKIDAEMFAGSVSPGESATFVLDRRHDIDDATFDPLIGDYQLDPDTVVYVARHDTAQFLYLMEGDRRIQIFPIGSRKFLCDDLRTLTFGVDESGAASAAVFTNDGESPQQAPRVRLYDEEDVAFENGDVRLAGTLTLPLGPGPHPALVFVHGSGPSNRASYSLFADLFARHGIACLCYDKRGVGQSTGNWRTADFDVLADDVLAGMHFLQEQPRIRSDKIGLWGISQAGWIIPLVASKSKDVAFIIPISGGAVTPAQQEAWRRRQNLLYQGVSERFIELGRKAAVMAFDWQRRHQLGQTPIPNVFADDALNMYHDAPGILDRMRQPVLAIFGGLDQLTPPHESAAIWADTLRRRGGGDEDSSVRVFPGGDHGIYVGGKTGSPLELRRELRFEPGFLDSMVRWIHHQTGGVKFDDVGRVDVEPGPIPVESRGLERLSVYGSGMVQPWLLVGLMLVFASAALAVPINWLWRRVRRATDQRSTGARHAMNVAAASGLLNLGILVGLVYVLYFLAQADPDPVVTRIGTIWNGLVLATWLSLILGVLVLRSCFLVWRGQWFSPFGQILYTLTAVAFPIWISFVCYWELLRPA